MKSISKQCYIMYIYIMYILMSKWAYFIFQQWLNYTLARSIKIAQFYFLLSQILTRYRWQCVCYIIRNNGEFDRNRNYCDKSSRAHSAYEPKCSRSSRPRCGCLGWDGRSCWWQWCFRKSPNDRLCNGQISRCVQRFEPATDKII